MATDRTEYFKAYREKHKQHNRDYQKEYRKNNFSKRNISMIKSLFKKLTTDEKQTVLTELNSIMEGGD